MFTNECQIMIYVDDVKKARDFWQALSFAVLDEQEIDGTFVVEMAPTVSSAAKFVLYDRQFVEQHSPEVATNAPSLMFVADDIFAVHKKMIEMNAQVGDIIQLEDRCVFNFADPDGNYFAISGN